VPNFGFNGLGELVYLRTYSRIKENGEKEEWWETCKRVVEWVYNTQKEHIERNRLGWDSKKAQSSAQEMYERIFDMKFLPPGRGLWIAGTDVLKTKPVAAALNNCFGAGTKFITDKGVVSMGDSACSVVNVLTELGTYEPASVQCFGEQLINRVTLKPFGFNTNYEIKYDVTENHRWKLSNGTITTALKEGDILFPSAEVSIKPSDEGFLHGMIYGDGTLHTYYKQRQIIRLCGAKNKYLKKIENLNGYISTTSPESYGGDHVVTYVRYDVNFKDLPNHESSLEYLKGFIDGWIAADGWDRSSGNICLDTQSEDDFIWLKENAASLGYYITGVSVDNRPTNYGERSSTLHRITISKVPMKYKVVDIERGISKENVFCVVEPKTKTFTLAEGVLTGNCAYTSTEKINIDPVSPFMFLMDMSMLGVGVGFDTKGAGKLTIQKPKDEVNSVVIEDSREGWVDALKFVLESYLIENKDTVILDYSHIRKYGEPIKGFGGVASGPDPLKTLIESIRDQFEGRSGQSITSEDIVDIMNKIGVCVVSGNVRRTAEIAIGSPFDKNYLKLKDYRYNTDTGTYEGDGSHRAAYGWTSNNSIFAELGMNYEEIGEQIAMNGEPGLIWLDNIRNFSRMDGAPDYKDWRAVGTNPCVSNLHLA